MSGNERSVGHAGDGDGSNTSDSGVYVARFGFNLRTVLTIIGCVAAMILIIWVPIDEDSRRPASLLLAKVIGFPLFGIGGLMFATTAAAGCSTNSAWLRRSPGTHPTYGSSG